VPDPELAQIAVAERTFEKIACLYPFIIVFTGDRLAGVGRGDVEIRSSGMKAASWKSVRSHEIEGVRPPIIATSR